MVEERSIITRTGLNGSLYIEVMKELELWYSDLNSYHLKLKT